MINGDSQSCVEAAYAMLDNPSITQDMLELIKIEEPIESAVSYDIMTIFQAMKGKAKEALIIGCKSVLSYTVLYKDLFGPGSPDVLVDVELLGLQTLYTRGDITHWINRHLFEKTIQSAHDYAGFLFGRMVKVSIEAVGFASGNSCFNFRGLIYHDPTDSTVTVNEEVLRQGFCKILPSSVYWSYEIKDSMRATYRSLFPNHRPLGTAFDAPPVSGFYQLGRIEMKLLLAEREAAQARRGVWVQAELPEQFLPPRLLQEGSRYSKRLVYIDNSNFWISGKHYSGDYKGLGQDKLFQRSAKLSRMSIANQEKFIDGIAAYRNMVYGRRPYYASDQSWRVNYQRLLELVGWDRNIDPEWVIAGSVPPENANVWDSFADLGADRVLTHRNAENKASTEDSTLAQRLGKCKEKKFSQIHHLTDYDDIILFGGDRFYKPIVKDILENCDHNRIFIITWGTSACYHGLKLKFSDRVSFINLEPYIDGLFYDVQLVRELSGDATSLSRANDEHCLIRFERKQFPVSMEDMHAVISTESESQLLQNIHYSLRKNGNYVFVIFRSQGNIAGDWRTRIQEALSKHVQTIAPAAQSTYSGRFSNLELEDDDDEDLDGDDELASYEVDDDIIGEDFDGHY